MTEHLRPSSCLLSSFNDFFSDLFFLSRLFASIPLFVHVWVVIYSSNLICSDSTNWQWRDESGAFHTHSHHFKLTRSRHKRIKRCRWQHNQRATKKKKTRSHSTFFSCYSHQVILSSSLLKCWTSVRGTRPTMWVAVSVHNEKSLCGTKSYYGYFIIKSNLLFSCRERERDRESKKWWHQD